MATTKFQRIMIQPILHNLSLGGVLKFRIHIWLFEQKDLKTKEIINGYGEHNPTGYDLSHFFKDIFGKIYIFQLKLLEFNFLRTHKYSSPKYLITTSNSPGQPLKRIYAWKKLCFLQVLS
ncbi:hypothetical protein Bca4012_037937 [Brassica carinata]